MSSKLCSYNLHKTTHKNKTTQRGVQLVMQGKYELQTINWLHKKWPPTKMQTQRQTNQGGVSRSYLSLNQHAPRLVEFNNAF
jgi:hypothetical protein